MDMVADKLVEPRDKDGNDKADTLADEAINFFGMNMPKLAAQYADRQAAYTHLVANIQHHLVRMYKARASLLQEHHQRHPPPQPPHIPAGTTSKHKWTQLDPNHLPHSTTVNTEINGGQGEVEGSWDDSGAATACATSSTRGGIGCYFR